ncbi:MAG: peroxiredoxin [Patescibacteria group bacterium]|nr:peroxiredoxin [Patescibacteria group bacterium]
MLNLNHAAPPFSGITAYQKGEFKKISLSDYKGQWLILFFYPRDFTFVCPTEIKAFSAQEPEFKKFNASILAASTDSEWSHKAWFERDLPEVNFPILADTSHGLSKAYDVFNEDDGSANRGLFIVDPDQMVRYALISAGSVGRSVMETLRVLEALQTGELCPAEWKMGEKTLGKA